MTDRFAILCGNANRALASAVARATGVMLGDAVVERFPDGEVSVEIRESVRDKTVFIVQSTAPPVNDHLMELLTMVNACQRGSAARVFAVIPYFGYARSDKRHARREPISARLIADLLQTAGTDHVITVDLHASHTDCSRRALERSSRVSRSPMSSSPTPSRNARKTGRACTSPR